MTPIDSDVSKPRTCATSSRAASSVVGLLDGVTVCVCVWGCHCVCDSNRQRRQQAQDLCDKFKSSVFSGRSTGWGHCVCMCVGMSVSVTVCDSNRQRRQQAQDLCDKFKSSVFSGRSTGWGSLCVYMCWEDVCVCDWLCVTPIYSAISRPMTCATSSGATSSGEGLLDEVRVWGWWGGGGGGGVEEGGGLCL